jgi:hypothetical protein
MDGSVSVRAGAIDLPANLVAIANAYGANTRVLGSGLVSLGVKAEHTIRRLCQLRSCL